MIDFATLQIAPLELADLDEVMRIENSVFTHPWSKTNFVDSLRNSDDAWVVRALDGELLGYFVQMAVVDEAHLLTLAVKASMQKQGLGNFILGLMLQQAKLLQMNSVLLEVRVSNLPALKMYEQFGFEQIGLRKNYYQADDRQREDALVLRYQLN